MHLVYIWKQQERREAAAEPRMEAGGTGAASHAHATSVGRKSSNYCNRQGLPRSRSATGLWIAGTEPMPRGRQREAVHRERRYRRPRPSAVLGSRGLRGRFWPKAEPQFLEK